MHGYGIVRTYLKAYVLMPLILAVPPVVLFFVFAVVSPYLGSLRGSPWVAGGITILCMVYWGVVLSLILERSFGRKQRSKDA
jgi:hypothetical protein